MNTELKLGNDDNSTSQVSRVLSGETLGIEYPLGSSTDQLVYPAFKRNTFRGRVLPVGLLASAAAGGYATGGWNGLGAGLGGGGLAAMVWSGETESRKSYKFDRQLSFYLRGFLPETKDPLDLVQLQADLTSSREDGAKDDIRLATSRRLMPKFSSAYPARYSAANLMTAFDKDVTNIAADLTELRYAIQEGQLSDRDEEAIVVAAGTLTVCNFLDTSAPLQVGGWGDYIVQKSLDNVIVETGQSTLSVG